MKEIELFFFDVDGTLFDNKSRMISPSTIQVLNRLKEMNKKIFICSGRGYQGIKDVETLSQIEWDGYVLLNGAVTADSQGNETFRHCMSKELIRKLNEVSNRNQRVLYCLGAEEWLTAEPDEHTLKAFEFAHRDAYAFEIRPLKEDDDLSMLQCFEEVESDYADFKEIKELYVLPTKHSYADLNDAVINKSVGMKKIAERLNVSLDKTMAFGDGINDLEMIECAGIGIAMGQAVEQIKEVADYVTDTPENDGIYKALVHYAII